MEECSVTDRAVQPEAPTLQEQIEWATSEYNTAVANGLIGRARIIGRRLDALEARAASQERPQPELPIWTEEQVAEGWIDPSPEACTCQRKDALGSYVPCSLHDVGVAQERPPIDVLAEALHAMGDACGPFTSDHPVAMHNSQAAAILARLAEGSVASPEPSDG
jgi:hypothetical protein